MSKLAAGCIVSFLQEWDVTNFVRLCHSAVKSRCLGLSLALTAVLVGLLMTACVEFQPGIESRVGLRSTLDWPQITLEIQEVRLEPCEELSTVRRFHPALKLWEKFNRLLIPLARAHDDPGLPNDEGTVVGGQIQVQLQPTTTWLPKEVMELGAYCSVSLTLAPSSQAGYSFVVLGEEGRSVRLLEPVQMRYPIEQPILHSAGELLLVLSFQSEPVREALAEGAVSSGDMRDVFREASSIEIQWLPEQG